LPGCALKKATKSADSYSQFVSTPSEKVVVTMQRSTSLCLLLGLALCGGAVHRIAIGAAYAAAAGVTGQATAAGKPAANAVIWLDAPGAPSATRPGKVVLDQRNLTFYPHVLAVRAGTTVDFPNNDRVYHNVFSYRDGKRFDLGLYPVGAVKHVTFAHAGLSRIFCNIHPNMAAYVMAVDTPYFGVSNREGRFSLPAVPPGSYTFHAWRPGAEELSGTVVARPGTAMEIRWP
jgi:plastocyanin